MTSRRYPLWEFLVPPSTFGSPERTAVEARGTRVRFADGTWALCATSGLWNVNLGYGNAAITASVAAALERASYLTLFRQGHALAIEAAHALLEVCGPDHFGRVLYSTSGGAANDCVMKLARHHHAIRGDAQRRIIVGLNGSYHGLTYGGFALTGEDLGQRGYSVDQRFVRHVDWHDERALTDLLEREGHRVAAIILEPVLGTGAFPLPRALLDALGPLRDKHGFLVIADEVATGFGRTGEFFASGSWPFRPDILVTSKGLTNGTCGAAALAISHEVCDVFDRADAVFVHGETQAGAPSTCAAILATIEEMHRLNACDRAREVGDALQDMLTRLTAHPLVLGHRGAGCFRALRLAVPGSGPAAVAHLRAAGVIVQPGPDAVQLIPALTYARDDLEELEAALLTGLDRTAELVSA